MEPWLSVMRVLQFLLSTFIAYCASSAPYPVNGPTNFASADSFLEYIQRQHFNYFLQEANAETGLVRDRSTENSACSIAAVGFSLSAFNVAAERGWITREQGLERTLRTLETFTQLPQGSHPTNAAGYRGWFYHFLDMRSGLRAWNSELSTIDTALLMMGVIDASLFYDSTSDPREQRVRDLASQLVNGMDWQFMLRSNDFQMSMEWRPERGHSPNGWVGYNEAMCLYLLGLGAGRNPLQPKSWDAWASGYSWTNYGGIAWLPCPPIFTHQYSHVWIDFRGYQDRHMRTRGIDYFENSRRAVLAQRQYAINNPQEFRNYSQDEWGFTACDGPGKFVGGVKYESYSARGAPYGQDDGTIAPTAAVASMPFAREYCLQATRKLYFKYGSRLWTNLGFRDSYNVKADWFAPDTLGIDQGPIVVMIENARSERVWRRMMKSEILQRGLARAGFERVPSGSPNSKVK